MRPLFHRLMCKMLWQAFLTGNATNPSTSGGRV